MSLKKTSAPPPPIQPSDIMPELVQWLRGFIGPDAELDFSWKDDAITICDMRVPSALRYGKLYTRQEIQGGVPNYADFEDRVKAFMSRGV